MQRFLTGTTTPSTFRRRKVFGLIQTISTLIASGSTGVRRYVSSQAEANALGLARRFSFAPVNENGVPTSGELGLWTGSPAATFNLDVDTDGDGIRESILVDLGYPPFASDNGKLVVPLFAIQVRDLNGLLNLNATTSKLSKTPFPPDITTQEFGADSFGVPRYLANSNLGVLSSEVNSIYGLTADQNAIS